MCAYFGMTLSAIQGFIASFVTGYLDANNLSNQGPIDNYYQYKDITLETTDGGNINLYRAMKEVEYQELMSVKKFHMAPRGWKLRL